MAHPPTPPLRWDTPLGLPVEVTFDAGRLTSDGGLPWLAEADTALGLCDALARCLPDGRRGPVRHSLATLLRQRIYQITCGYADQNDATTLRQDPLLKLVCGRRPTPGAALASQPTFSRLENAVDRHAVEALATAGVELYLRERARAGVPQRIVLDFDGTADPAHGQHEGVGYHGSYRPYLYHPLLVFDGDTGPLIPAVRRPGRCHGSRFAILVLRRLVRRRRRAWPDLAIELRADSGFAIPRLYAWCEAHAVRYTLGLLPNPALERRAAPRQAVAHACSTAPAGAKVRLVAATD